ncbi:hypothetical protein D9611_004286 [Ephemerocybe angulata]|uniref:BTB domain-containing protein n=1 Tax=Ephemerocybe angulata TaxID=980116 RepID=A0A8H5BJU1_9AGAR|nr:hypothetical protein D9611_004286 [Tulosesus angulatus]
MSSAASSSGSVNGRAPLTNGTNGTSSYGEVSPSTAPFHEPNGTTPPATSYPVNGYSNPYQPSHNESIVNHLYHAFQTGNYADTTLHVHQNAYRLHAVILSRSPYLAHLMSTSPQTTGQRVIYVNLEQEPEVTQEGFAIALGYLYSSISLNLIHPENARAVLAAGCLLGGMDDLCQYAYEVCRRSLSVDTIGAWLKFVEAIPHQPANGSVTPSEVIPTVFGHYAQRLRDDVFHFLVVTLPEVLEVRQNPQPQPDATSGETGRDVLLQVYAQVPFDMFKSAVESPTFNIGSDQARFKFAKDAIELRKRGISRGSGEETVVLAFGNNFGGSAVHVTRKLRKRPLWKVNS